MTGTSMIRTTADTADTADTALGDRVPAVRRHPARERDLSDIARAWATWTPERVAVIDEDGEHTWGELDRRIEALAAGLRERGLTRGDAVAVADSPCVDMVALYLATARSGLVLVPLNIRLRAAELADLIEVGQPGLILASAEYADLVAGAVSASSGAAGSSGGMVVGDARASWGDRLAAAAVGENSPEDPDAGSYDAPHLLLFTSGTTGRPKAALLGQRRSLGDAAWAALASGVTAEDRLLGYQPLYHTGGWDFLKQYLLVGGSVVLMRTFDADQALELMERHRCTSLFAVPLVLLKLMESPRFVATDLSAFRRLMYASYEPSDLVQRAVVAFQEQGAGEIRLEHVYGQTEAGSFIATLRGADVRPDRLDSVGRPVPGVTVSLLDQELRPVPRGASGEICVRSETVMLGYLDNLEATAEAFRGGWLHTGDLGRQDEDGLLRITGRLKEMIRTAGENVFPKEVEAILVSHPDIADCAVFGVPDDRYDERVVAVVAPVPGRAPDIDMLVAYLKERLAGYKVPRRILVLDELPKTPAGKTARQQLPSLFDPSPGGDR